MGSPVRPCPYVYLSPLWHAPQTLSWHWCYMCVRTWSLVELVLSAACMTTLQILRLMRPLIPLPIHQHKGAWKSPCTEAGKLISCIINAERVSGLQASDIASDRSPLVTHADPPGPDRQGFISPGNGPWSICSGSRSNGPQVRRGLTSRRCNILLYHPAPVNLSVPHSGIP